MREADDPRCPECGGPIGMTATYCMHCSTDLTDERAAADDGTWDGTDVTGSTQDGSGVVPTDRGGDELLDPDGLVDDTLTVVVGIAGGLLVGIVGTTALVAITGSGWGFLLGVAAWLGATAYLVRRQTVQEAVAKSGYAVAIVLLLVPVIALTPVVDVDGGIQERGGVFVVLVLFAALPAAVAAGIGWVASRFVPDGTTETRR